MKKIYPYLWLIALSAIYGCDRAKNEENRIDVEINKRDAVSIFDLFDRVSLIPLETTGESLIGYIQKVIVYHDTCFVFDYSLSQVFAFNGEGKFLYRINGKGNGPNEYLSICDMAIDSIGQEIELLSPVDRSLHSYTMDGMFRKRMILPEIELAYKSFIHLDADMMAFWTYDEKNCVKFYSKTANKILGETFPEEDNFFNRFFSTEFPYANCLVRSSENAVYSVLWDGKNGRVEKGYEWDFGRYNNGRKTHREAAPVFESQREMMTYAREKVNTSEVVNYIFMLHGGNRRYRYAQINRKMTPVNIFHDLKTHHTVIFEKTTEGAYICPIFWTDEYVIGRPFPMKEMSEVIPDTILSDEDRIQKKQITEEDNPYLIKYYFR